MKVNVQIHKEFEVAAIGITAEVRYWEDATVNGVEDTDGALIPLRFGNHWIASIDLASGRVQNWPKGITADIHYKVCDAGEYALLDEEMVVARRSGYVPDMLGVSEPSYGDYIIMKIGADGLIDGWKPPQIDPDGWSWALQS